MNPADERDVRDLIRLKVRGGFDAPEQVAQAVAEDYFDVGLDEADVREWIADAFDDHAAEERGWAAQTDCDRLDATFAGLQRQGILVLQNAGVTQEDALADAAEAYHAAGAEQSGVVGFCFYTGQDLDHAADADDGELMLGFGDVDGNEPAGVEVGRRIRAALEADGFTVRWDGTMRERIAVVDLNWQRRRG